MKRAFYTYLFLHGNYSHSKKSILLHISNYLYIINSSCLCLQVLKNSRLVINSSMYRQIAETYIASRKTPVRRTCSSGIHSNGRFDDLVCDSSPTLDTPLLNSTSNSPVNYQHNPCDSSAVSAHYLQSLTCTPTSSTETLPTSHSTLASTPASRMQQILPISERQVRNSYS